MRSNTLTTEHVVIESRLDGSDDNDSDLHDPDISSDNENLMSPIDDDILENESTHSNFKRKNKETINENANLRKKICKFIYHLFFLIIMNNLYHCIYISIF